MNGADLRKNAVVLFHMQKTHYYQKRLLGYGYIETLPLNQAYCTRKYRKTFSEAVWYIKEEVTRPKILQKWLTIPLQITTPTLEQWCGEGSDSGTQVDRYGARNRPIISI